MGLTARYDLSRMPANFNFIEFLVAATTLGADKVVLDRTRIKPKFEREDTEIRLANIVIPACDFAGVHVSYGRGGEDLCDYHISAVLDAYRKTGFIKKLKSVLPHRDVKYTITIRDYPRYEQRNSNREAWERFAEKIGALVIDDWYRKPIDLHERMALYCGAEMNYHVGNGPACLCYFSDAPMTCFLKGVDLDYHVRHKFPFGSQLPWLNPNQRFIWEEDTYENIESRS